MPKRLKVALFGPMRKFAMLDGDATKGARVGTDLLWPDGTVVQESEIRGTVYETVIGGGITVSGIVPDGGVDDPSGGGGGGGGGGGVALWGLILGIPDIIQNIEDLTDTGLMVHTGSENIAAREITGETLRILVTDGDGVSGDPEIKLGPFPTVKQSIEAGEEYTLPDGHQMVVWDEFLFDGGNLIIEGELVVIGAEDKHGPVTTAYLEKGVNYTLVHGDHVVVATVAGLTFTLPSAAGMVGQEFILKNSSAGSLTIDGYATETIDGGLTAVLNTQYESITVISNGTNWGIV